MKEIVREAPGCFRAGMFGVVCWLAAWLAVEAGAAVIQPGETLEGSVAVAGEVDAWTFSAGVGDAIVVRVGDESTGVFTPKIQLLSPSSVLLASGSGAVAAEVAVTATNAGTFTVRISDGTGATNQTGPYRLSLAKTGGSIVVDAGDQGGPMTNGVMHAGTILAGELDCWTVTANAGDALVVRMGEVTDTNTFWPWVRLYGPDGKLLDSAYNSAVAEVAVNATNSGAFLVVVGDGNGGLSGSGDYRLTLAKTGDPVVVSAGDNGGPMTNGVMHLGTIQTGDLDLWTFSANAGDALLVRMGEITDTNTFFSWVRLYGPNGRLLASAYNTASAEVAVSATNSGTFLVVVGDGNGGLYGSGDYRLTLAKTGDPVVVSAGDNGGPLTNGAMHLGTIQTGDLDLWTFSATAGEGLLVRMGEITDTNLFYPYVRIYGPNGKLLDSSYGASAAEVGVSATNTGTFLVVVGDGNGGLYGAGDYRLTLAKTGDAVVVSAGDDGGPMTNGWTHLGTVVTGDLDLWTFTASPRQAVVVRVGAMTSTNLFYPWIRLYSPAGALLGSSYNASSAEIAVTATNSGMFLLVAGDGNGGLYGSGDYRLTLAKAGDPLAISPGDEGGSLTAGLDPVGTIGAGDLDTYQFTTCRGESFTLQVNELVDGGTFYPQLRIYGPGGALLGSSFGPATAQLTLTATNSGAFLAVVSDGNGSLSGLGTYQLIGTGASDELRLCVPVISGTNETLTGIGGVTNAVYVLLTSTNAATPAASWTPVTTNLFDALGLVNYTNVYVASESQRFFRLRTP
ncbi:MAG: hypothetical protein U1F98_09965 [Verrucomicrobiota bacterium]